AAARDKIVGHLQTGIGDALGYDVDRPGLAGFAQALRHVTAGDQITEAQPRDREDLGERAQHNDARIFDGEAYRRMFLADKVDKRLVENAPASAAVASSGELRRVIEAQHRAGRTVGAPDNNRVGALLE